MCWEKIRICFNLIFFFNIDFADKKEILIFARKSLNYKNKFYTIK